MIERRIIFNAEVGLIGLKTDQVQRWEPLGVVYEPTTFNGTLDLLIWSGVLRLPDLEASDYWEPSRKRRTGLLGFVTERATWCK